jgi:hypothetical protein
MRPKSGLSAVVAVAAADLAAAAVMAAAAAIVDAAVVAAAAAGVVGIGASAGSREFEEIDLARKP